MIRVRPSKYRKGSIAISFGTTLGAVTRHVSVSEARRMARDLDSLAFKMELESQIRCQRIKERADDMTKRAFKLVGGRSFKAKDLRRR